MYIKIEKRWMKWTEWMDGGMKWRGVGWVRGRNTRVFWPDEWERRRVEENMISASWNRKYQQ